LRRKHIANRAIKPIRRIAPTTDPITIPAIAPPDKPFRELEFPVNVAEGDDVADDVEVLVAKVMKAVIVGNTTLAHLVFAFEL